MGNHCRSLTATAFQLFGFLATTVFQSFCFNNGKAFWSAAITIFLLTFLRTITFFQTSAAFFEENVFRTTIFTFSDRHVNQTCRAKGRVLLRVGCSLV
jgi:hypothetical protein